MDHLGVEGGLARIFDAATGKQLLSIPTKLTPAIQAWSADSRRIYLNARDAKLNRSWIVCFDADSGKRIFQTRLAPELTSTGERKFSQDARWFGVLCPDERLLHVYDAREGKLVGTASAPVLSGSMSFSPNGRSVACRGSG